MKKIERNELCPCGSGKKFKKCHREVTDQSKIAYAFKDIHFGSNSKLKNYIQLVGDLFNLNNYNIFKLLMTPLINGEWQLRELSWTYNPDQITNDLAQELINKASQLVTATNMWAGDQINGGAQVLLNQKRIPDEAFSTNTVSFRSSLLSLPIDNWDTLWDRIEQRIHFDSFFRVHGFSKEEVLRSLKILKNIFPSEWVKARYRKANPNANSVKLGDKFSQGMSKSWFPAYHLARTALGAICVDPGWNYLIDIALSVQELETFKECKKLTDELCKNPGTRHHLSLAAELYKKNFLVGLEPPTGAGSATNDLLVKINGNQYAIEVKEFISNDPLKKLKMEMKNKSEKLPANPDCPTIFSIVLRDEGEINIKKEKDFLKNLDTIKTGFPRNISAVVASSRFIDSTGGRIKRKIEKIVLNPSFTSNNSLADLEMLFQNNYSEIKYPCYGIGSFFYFE